MKTSFPNMQQGAGRHAEASSLKIVRDLKNYLTFLKATGSHFVCVPDRPVPALKQERLEQLRAQAERCTKCRLAKTRTRVVFGEGDADAGMVFVGEAPGENEDLQGRPFVGAAGNLLTQLIEQMGLRRHDVFICNVIKCRPPNNRDPQPDEITACEDYLVQQLDILKPRVICTLGRYAAQTLLRTSAPISRLRGNRYLYQHIPVIPTYHPANLLYQPGNRQTVLNDLKKAMAEYRK
jgi:uracil-DNA glycosylase family 4